MYLCYVDESGNTGRNLKDKHQPFHVLTALLVPPNKIKEIEVDVKKLSSFYFPDDYLNDDFELHGDGIYNRRGKYLNNLVMTQSISLFEDIVKIVNKHESIKVGYVSIEKAKYFAAKHIHQTAFSLLVEKLEERLKGYLNSYCLLIADEHQELEQVLVKDFDTYKETGTTFGYNRVLVDRIIDSIHFVRSNNNYLMQVTDVVCYLIRKGIEASSKLYEMYSLYRADLKNEMITYQDWLDLYASKTPLYFRKMYHTINSAKPWIFAKDFP